MRHLIAILLLGLASAGGAHDFWIDLPAYRAAPGQPIDLRFLIGDSGKAEGWETAWRKIVSLRSYGPAGVRDQQADIRTAPDRGDGGAGVVLGEPGTHVIAFETMQSESDLPADEFTAYAEHEGLTPLLKARQQAGTTATARGRELYSRRAKALVQVGTTPTANVTVPIGQTLELVPAANPYALASGAPLVLTVLYRGRPLAGASVALETLDRVAPHAKGEISDAAGNVTFAMPAAGRWRATVVWSQACDHPRADFDTVFASLTFGRLDSPSSVRFERSRETATEYQAQFLDFARNERVEFTSSATASPLRSPPPTRDSRRPVSRTPAPDACSPCAG